MRNFIKAVVFIGIIMVMSQTVETQGPADAEKVWDLAITAKGGRQALRKIDNILLRSTSPSRTTKGRSYLLKRTSLIVLPGRVWSYSDERPEVFGEYVDMLNYENMTEYFVPKGSDRIATPSMPAHARVMKAYQNSMITLLMESRWLRPKIVSMQEALIEKEKVFLIQTDVDGRRVDFALSQSTYLPVKITIYRVGIEGVDEVSLSNYVEIDGIKVPRTRRFNNQSIETLTVQFNVDYDPSIFIRAPSRLSPDAWQKK